MTTLASIRSGLVSQPGNCQTACRPLQGPSCLRGTPEHLLPASSSPYMHTDQELHPAHTPAGTSATMQAHGSLPAHTAQLADRLAHPACTQEQDNATASKTARANSRYVVHAASHHQHSQASLMLPSKTSTISTCHLLAEGNTGPIVPQKSSTSCAAGVHRSTCKQSQGVTNQQVHKLHTTGNRVGCYSVDTSHEQQERTLGCHCCWKTMQIVHAAA